MKTASVLSFGLLSWQVLAGPLPAEKAERDTSTGCKTFKTDSNFPSQAEWMAVSSSMKTSEGPGRPDYHFTALSSADVVASMKFVAKHNLRISILNSGHDFLGRYENYIIYILDVN
jgi:hypothetical protein